MSLSIYSKFKVLRAGTEKGGLGIANLFATLVAAGETSPISILADDGESTPAPNRADASASDDWSTWIYAFGQWRMATIGAVDLDDVCDDIIDRLTDPDFSGVEIRICPPGTMCPCQRG